MLVKQAADAEAKRIGVLASVRIRFTKSVLAGLVRILLAERYPAACRRRVLLTGFGVLS